MVGDDEIYEASSGDEKFYGGKNLNPYIWGETVLQRPKDLLQLNKNMMNSTISLSSCAYKTEDSAIGRLGMSNFEGRIAEVEKFVKMTTKMMQVKVEIVDQKLTKVEEKRASLDETSMYVIVFDSESKNEATKNESDDDHELSCAIYLENKEE
ncbi:hypothetical protein NE237_000800 [Protea cynaroides]|uniref:Uncharacterized protein n=1 Tax=Protea cynaroides TaxID=273540 RepID=A0A9Q0KS93_9MAGN|nr:hypothetical protein NE237_000800 [Protea cynaroides]